MNTRRSQSGATRSAKSSAKKKAVVAPRRRAAADAKKKAVAKTPAPRKKVAKKTVAKAPVKKRAAAKTAKRKNAAVAPRRAAATITKKSATKKPVAKKPATQKSAVKKTVAKAPVKKRVAAKATTSVKKKVAAATPRRGAAAAAKKASTKNAVVKKPVVKKPAAKKAVGSVAKRTAAKVATTTRKAAIRKAATSPRKTAPVRRPKSFAAPETVHGFGFAPGAPDLPEAYGEDRLVLMAKDPGTLFAYWEITPARTAAAEAAMRPGEEYREVLRLDWTVRELFETNYALLPVSFAARRWYLRVPYPGLTYQLELGWLGSQGHYIPLLQSNPSDAPEAWAATRDRLKAAGIDPNGVLSYLLDASAPQGASGGLTSSAAAPGSSRPA